METAIVVLLLTIGAVVGSLVTYAWMQETGQPGYHDDTQNSVGEIP